METYYYEFFNSLGKKIGGKEAPSLTEAWEMQFPKLGWIEYDSYPFFACVLRADGVKFGVKWSEIPAPPKPKKHGWGTLS